MSKKNFLERLFPVKYDFFEMLYRQAQINAQTIDTLYVWLKNGAEADSNHLLAGIERTNEVRKKLESDLVEAFSTPFDRGDIYSISISMYQVIDYAKSTLLSMQSYQVSADDTILFMTENLKSGADIFAESMNALHDDPKQSESKIADIRQSHISIERLYRDGMAGVFLRDDAMDALRKREIYHHIKDASSYLDNCVDILHRIIVRLT
ncbi:MAG: DUF47 domain-containing protein [Anaerofustis sp.]